MRRDAGATICCTGLALGMFGQLENRYALCFLVTGVRNRLQTGRKASTFLYSYN
jgi:hypothetical protein